MKSIRVTSDNYDEVSEELINIYESSYPEESYPLYFVYSKEGIKKAVTDESLHWFYYSNKGEVFGAVMYYVEENNLEILGLTVKPEYRGKALFLKGIHKHFMESSDYYFNKLKLSKVVSDMQLEAYPSLVSSTLGNAKPFGFFPNKRNIKTGKERRVSMYVGGVFPSLSTEYFELKDTSNCILNKRKELENIIMESKPLIDSITDFYGFEKVDVKNPLIDSSVKEVKVHNLEKSNDLIVSHIQKFSIKEDVLNVYIVENDKSAKIVYDFTNFSNLYSLVKTAIEKNSNIEYFEVETRSPYEQKVFYNFGFRPCALNIGGSKNSEDLLNMSKVVGFNKKDYEYIDSLNKRSCNKAKKIFNIFYKKDNHLETFINTINQYENLTNIVLDNFSNLL